MNPDSDYVRRHALVVKARGKAALYPCGECGCQARDWATIHERAGWDVGDYRPLCRKCHLRYDDVPAKHSAATAGKPWSPRRRAADTPEVRAKLSTAAQQRTGAKHTPETRAKISAAMTGKKASLETLAKLSASQKGKQLSPEHRAKISRSLIGNTRRKGKRTSS